MVWFRLSEKIKPVNGHHNQEMSLAMKSQNHETEKMAQIFTVLQQAKVDFDLKKQLWQSIQNMPTIKTALTVTSLAPKNLSDALLEILLNDHAWIQKYAGLVDQRVSFKH